MCVCCGGADFVCVLCLYNMFVCGVRVVFLWCVVGSFLWFVFLSVLVWVCMYGVYVHACVVRAFVWCVCVCER